MNSDTYTYAKRKILIATGSRAEFGLLRWIMHDIEADSELELQVAVTGMHLSPEYGNTYEEILAAGFPIHEKVESLLSSNDHVGMSKSLGLGVIGFAEVFQRLNPDIVLILGDRFEILAVATSAMLASIPIAHIAGGHITEGSIDDSIRHAITKMSHLHFTAVETYRRRIIQLGEAPDSVFTVGSTGLDTLKRLPLLNQKQLEKSLKVNINTPLLVVSFHPETLADQSSFEITKELLLALEHFPDHHIVITMPNADAGRWAIKDLFNQFFSNFKGRCAIFDSLGQQRYLSLLKLADVLIGNSSSGIIEAPSLGIPTINIGDRQKGRIRAESVIDVLPKANLIKDAIQLGLSDQFKEKIQNLENPYYGNGDSAGEIIKTLKKVSFSELKKKSFYNIPFDLLKD